MKKISIVIVTYNSSQIIEDCLASIFATNDLSDSLEVLIVDNNSPDFEVLKTIIDDKFYEKVSLIRNFENAGYGQGNNIGVKNATAPIILITNPDVLFFKPQFKEIVDSFESNPTLAILGMQQYESESKKRQSFLMLRYSLLNLFLHKLFSFFSFYHSKLFCFSGACFAIRKTSFIEAGQFDEKIFLYGEERDLHYRILECSSINKIRFNPSLGYIHPVDERDLSLKSVERALDSHQYVEAKRKGNLKRMYSDEKRIYSFMKTISYLKGQEKQVNYYSEVLNLIKERLKKVK